MMSHFDIMFIIYFSKGFPDINTLIEEKTRDRNFNI